MDENLGIVIELYFKLNKKEHFAQHIGLGVLNGTCYQIFMSSDVILKVHSSEVALSRFSFSLSFSLSFAGNIFFRCT